jgi:predicted ATPase/DNA-binding SARP family transcriptional activator
MPLGSGDPRLPVPLTPLLGRERELDETSRLLERTRLLTITGAGGSGKTRIALELAHRSAPRYALVVWVDLAPIAEPDLIGQQILNALGIREAPTAEVMQVIIDSLRDTSTLLVLDNCEHLVDACAMVSESILRSCPATTVLATTREALGIAGEQTWLVPPLSPQDATQLFVERARAVSPTFHVTYVNEPFIERICRRLDGIPLAIELAAARVKVLSVEQIAERLSDAFRLLSSGSRTLPRHRTIKETIDWSYRLLSEDEQLLLRRLAVFSGSFSLNAAETICSEDALEVLAALMDKSLVLREEGGDARYRLLETVRQFAMEKLSEAGERDRMRELHARHFFEAIEAAEPRIFGGAVDPPTLAWIDDEMGNIRAVFEWAEEDPSRAELELRMLYALHWYWFARGHFHEARRRIAQALSRAGDVDPVVRARAYVAAGDAAVWQADWNALRPRIDEAVAILRETNDSRALAMALMLLGTAHAFADKDDYSAMQAMNEAKEAARAHGRDVGLALALYWSGIAAQLRGDWSAARAEFEEARQLGEELRNKPAIGHANAVLGYVELHERRYDEAVRCFRRALDVHAEIDDRWGLTQVVEGIGLALLESGDAETGTRLLAAASAAWLHLGARPGREDEFEQDKDLRIRRALTDDRLRVVLASGAAMPYDAMIALARESAEKLGAARAKPRLRVRALGPLEVELDGAALDVTSVPARSRELLLYLLSQPKGAAKEQIGAALWPDADAARLRNNFHVTLHRLRKLLGGAEWISVENETYSIDRKLVEFDVDVFETEARSAIRSGDLQRLTRAAKLYRGDFKQGPSSNEWQEERSDELRELYTATLAALGRARIAAGDLDGAIDAFETLTTLDPLDEEAARNLMSVHAKRGDKTAAARVYKKLSDTLRKQMDSAPETATTRLYEQLL